MTDLEITRLCAEAMETPPTLPGASSIWGFSKEFVSGRVDTWVRSTYDPLNDDAQAMAMVKKFKIRLDTFFDETWIATANPWEKPIEAENKDLNRAICECVAKMRAAK